MTLEQPTGRRIQRVRTGCWTCRRRGYRCDETKPRCNECTRLSLECEGYGIRLRWTATLAPNGVSTSSRRQSGRSRRGRPVANGSAQQQLRTPSRWLPDWPSGAPETFLVQHFFYTVSSLLASTNDRSINVYCTVILPMAFDSPLVLRSVLLLSSTHLATRYSQFGVRSALYKSQVFRLLIDRIATWPSSSPSSSSTLPSPSTCCPPAFDLYGLTSIILLSINEVFEANSPGDWVTHLTAAGKLITNYMQSMSGTAAPDETGKTVRMLQDIFAYHNVLALLSTGEQSLVLDLYDNDNWSSHSGHRTAFLAAVDTLLSIAARLSRLYAHPRKGPDNSLEAGNRRDDARRLRQRLDRWHPPAGISDDTRHTAEAMRHATLLIYYKALASTGPLGAEDKGAAAASSKAIVQHLGHVPVQSSTTASHVWPLYMAGSVPEMGLTVPAASRQFIRDRLVTMEYTRGVKSVATARQRLDNIWGAVATANLSPHQAPMFLF